MGQDSECGDATKAASVTLRIGLPERLRDIRMYLGKSQTEMDPLLGIGKKSWQRYESGGHLPGSQFVAALVQVGFNANWLLAGEGPMRLEDMYPAKEGMTAEEQRLEGRLNRVERLLSRLDRFPVLAENIMKNQGLAYAYEELQEITQRSDIRGPTKARADTMLLLAFADKAGEHRGEDRLHLMGKRLRLVNEIWNDAAEAAEYESPLAVAEAIRTAIFDHDLSTETVLRLIVAFHEEQG